MQTGRRLALLLTLVPAACGDGAPAPAPPAETGPCAQHRWDFAGGTGALAGVSFDPSTAIAAAPDVASAPAFAGRPGPALRIPVRFTPIDYIVPMSLAVCQPTPASNLLDKHFSTRFFLDGPAFPGDAELSVFVWPQMRDAAVPLSLKSSGVWVDYGGVFAPANPDGRPSYETVGDVAVSMIYAGTETWSGTIWVGDVEVGPAAQKP